MGSSTPLGVGWVQVSGVVGFVSSNPERLILLGRAHPWF